MTFASNERPAPGAAMAPVGAPGSTVSKHPSLETLFGRNAPFWPILRSGSLLRDIASLATKALFLCLIVTAILLSTPVAVAALRSGLGIDPLPFQLAQLDQRLPVVFRIHMLAGGLGLLLLPWAMLVRRYRTLHRWLGRAAAGLLLVGAAAALPSALASVASPFARLGFFVQGSLFLFFMGRAVRAAMQHRMRRHMRLVACAAAIAFGAVLLRIMLAVVAMNALPFGPSYAVIAWISWGLPLLGVLWWKSPVIARPCSKGRACSQPSSQAVERQLLDETSR